MSVVHALLVCGFLRALWRRLPKPLADEACPKTAVILCLRGADPYLGETIRALLRLDYPLYDVSIVVDSGADPAWRLAEEIVKENQNIPVNIEPLVASTNVGRIANPSYHAVAVRVEPLVQRRETCSLKCGSLVQAVAGLDESYQVVALVDADTIPHRGWLRELVAPLADERVGAATGNRWYMPEGGEAGALVRYLWNAAAVIQMFWFRIAWGGTLAVKTEALRRCNLPERWANAFCEDTMLFGILRRHGYRLVFVPSLMMVNRESIDLPGFFRWMRRQLLAARLYHPSWWAVVGHGVVFSLVPALLLVLFALALCRGEWAPGLWSGGGLAVYLASILLQLAPVEIAVRRIVRARGESTSWLNLKTLAGALPALICTQIVHAAGLVSVSWLRTVEWRRVIYRIEGPWKVRLIEDRPYESRAGGDDRASL